jgi:integrase
MAGKLNDTFCGRQPHTTEGFRRIPDGAVPGFALRVGVRSKVFEWRYSDKPYIDPKTKKRRRDQHTIDLGQWPHVSAEEARTRALDKQTRHRKGEPLEGPRRGAATLATAWESYKDSPRKNGKPRAKNTLDAYAAAFKRFRADVANRPLRDLANDPTIVTKEDARIRKENGAAAATQAARFGRAVYGWARKALDKKLPAGHPWEAIATTDPPGPQPALSAAELAEWWREVRALPNPIHRYAHALQLFTGLRVSDLIQIEWSQIDWENRSLRLTTSTKGGHAFYLPLSRQAMACLYLARAVGGGLHPEQARRWAFPKPVASGHLDRHELGKASLTHKSHDLRRTFGQLGEDALHYPPQEGRQVLARFYNHGAGGITDRYLARTRAGAAAIEDMQAIGDYIRACLRGVHALSSDQRLQSRAGHAI